MNTPRYLQELVRAYTKREIKILIAQLSNTVRGLIQWGRYTGKVTVNTSSRATQTDPGLSVPPATTQDYHATKSAKTQAGSHIGVEAKPEKDPEDIVPLPDRSRFELPASIEGLRLMIKTQGDEIAKLAEKVHKIQGKPQQQRQQKPPSNPTDNVFSTSQQQQQEARQQQLDTGNRKPRTEKKGRPDVIIVKADGISYAEMLKKIKASKEMKTAGDTINAVTKTKDGHLRMVIKRGVNDKKKSGSSHQQLSWQ